MDEFFGIELLESVNINSQVIIMIVYQQYVLKGFELNVIDYLFKFFIFFCFLQVVNKVKENLVKEKLDFQLDFIFVKIENWLEKIMVVDIFYIEGMWDYCCIYIIFKSIMMF